jgi:phospholipid N-methyltransferase
MFSRNRVFFREFRNAYRTTGAVLPSGSRLARTICRYVRDGNGQVNGAGRRILEVGPGTGAITEAIVRVLHPGDRLDLVEINPQFVDVLNSRFANEPAFSAVADRSRVIPKAIQELDCTEPYDLIVSGLPFNNFSPEEVRNILQGLRGLIRPDGVLSFFQYIGIRRAKALVSGANDRERLLGIGQVLEEILREAEFRRDRVLINVPPAWVHHLKWGTRVNGSKRTASSNA